MHYWFIMITEITVVCYWTNRKNSFRSRFARQAMACCPWTTWFFYCFLLIIIKKWQCYYLLLNRNDSCLLLNKQKKTALGPDLHAKQWHVILEQHDSSIILFILPSISWLLNSLWHSEAIRRQETESTLAQVMTCCLTAPSHYLNQCWLIISKVQRHPSESNFTKDTSAISHWN